jgi:hypothetical protein
LKGEAFVAPSIIIPNNNGQRSVKRKLDFIESKSNFKQKTLLDITVVDKFYVTFI